jgi:hypothetical protein
MGMTGGRAEEGWGGRAEPQRKDDISAELWSRMGRESIVARGRRSGSRSRTGRTHTERDRVTRTGRESRRAVAGACAAAGFQVHRPLPSPSLN